MRARTAAAVPSAPSRCTGPRRHAGARWDARASCCFARSLCPTPPVSPPYDRCRAHHHTLSIGALVEKGAQLCRDGVDQRAMTRAQGGAGLVRALPPCSRIEKRRAGDVGERTRPYQAIRQRPQAAAQARHHRLERSCARCQCAQPRLKGPRPVVPDQHPQAKRQRAQRHRQARQRRSRLRPTSNVTCAWEDHPTERGVRLVHRYAPERQRQSVREDGRAAARTAPRYEQRPHRPTVPTSVKPAPTVPSAPHAVPTPRRRPPAPSAYGWPPDTGTPAPLSLPSQQAPRPRHVRTGQCVGWGVTRGGGHRPRRTVGRNDASAATSLPGGNARKGMRVNEATSSSAAASASAQPPPLGAGSSARVATTCTGSMGEASAGRTAGGRAVVTGAVAAEAGRASEVVDPLAGTGAAVVVALTGLTPDVDDRTRLDELAARPERPTASKVDPSDSAPPLAPSMPEATVPRASSSAICDKRGSPIARSIGGGGRRPSSASTNTRARGSPSARAASALTSPSTVGRPLATASSYVIWPPQPLAMSKTQTTAHVAWGLAGAPAASGSAPPVSAGRGGARAEAAMGHGHWPAPTAIGASAVPGNPPRHWQLRLRCWPPASWSRCHYPAGVSRYPSPHRPRQQGQAPGL
jgi:hypothetical protein